MPSVMPRWPLEFRVAVLLLQFLPVLVLLLLVLILPVPVQPLRLPLLLLTRLMWSLVSFDSLWPRGIRICICVHFEPRVWLCGYASVLLLLH